MSRKIVQNIKDWFCDRLPVDQAREYLSQKSVPQHKHSIWYYFGGLTLFFFAVQIVTGILLAVYYKPTPELAHESVRSIMNDIPFGWAVRSVHSWSANVMVAMMFVHMFSAFFMRAYRKPRELIWISGVLLLFLVLGFAFTGYLLPWDSIAYFATLIGTEVPQTLPLIGTWGVSLLKGGVELGGETLIRMYTLHVIILPLSTIVIVGFHLLLNVILGTSEPIGIRSNRLSIPFFPDFLIRDVMAWIAGFVALVILATMYPPGLGEKADPLASAPLGIKPEWYFLPLYQTLRMVPSNLILFTGEFLVNVLVGIGAAIWLCIPFLDKAASRGVKSKLITVLGLILISYLAITIILAYSI